MRLFSAYAVAAAIIGGSLLAGPAAAAPDQTQGVALMSARVDEGGALDTTSSAGAVSATRTSAGRYDVVFNRPVSGCVPVGNTNGVNSGALRATISVNPDTNPNAFDVLIKSTDGTNSDEDFQLLVFCPR